MIFTDKPIDKVIATQTQIIILREQMLSVMKLHLQALEETSRENPIMDILTEAYRQIVESEEKTVEASYNSLEVYKKHKALMEDTESD